MDVVLLTPVRLLSDGLTACFRDRAGIRLCSTVRCLSDLRAEIERVHPQLILIDVMQGVDLYDIRSLVVEHSDVAIIALGLVEQRQQVVSCGRAGFTGYVSREATAEQLCAALHDMLAGRQSCPAEISGGLLRALFRAEAPPADAAAAAKAEVLTKRESDVLGLLGQGLSNKEIARQLTVSVATVKHHVHRILEKMNLQRRAQAMRRVRDAPWLVAHGRTGTK